MAAFGIVIVYFIYGVLGLFALYGIRRWYKADSSLQKASAIVQTGLGIGLLLLLVGMSFYRHRKDENAYIGTYMLTAYPDCPTCVLHLNSNNQYEVRQGDLVKEQGPWYYESGGDYWIVHMNHGQLGLGMYEYDFDARKNGSQKHMK